MSELGFFLPFRDDLDWQAHLIKHQITRTQEHDPECLALHFSNEVHACIAATATDAQRLPYEDAGVVLLLPDQPTTRAALEWMREDLALEFVVYRIVTIEAEGADMPRIEAAFGELRD